MSISNSNVKAGSGRASMETSTTKGIVTSDTSQSRVQRIRGTRSTNEDASLGLFRKNGGLVQKFLLDKITPLVPVSQVGKVRLFLSTRTHSELEQLIRHSDSASMFKTLMSIQDEWIKSEAANSLSWMSDRDLQGLATSGDFDPYHTYQSFFIGSMLGYLNQFPNISKHFTPDACSQIEDLVDVYVFEWLSNTDAADYKNGKLLHEDGAFQDERISLCIVMDHLLQGRHIQFTSTDPIDEYRAIAERVLCMWDTFGLKSTMLEFVRGILDNNNAELSGKVNDDQLTQLIVGIIGSKLANFHVGMSWNKAGVRLKGLADIQGADDQAYMFAMFMGFFYGPNARHIAPGSVWAFMSEEPTSHTHVSHLTVANIPSISRLGKYIHDKVSTVKYGKAYVDILDSLSHLSALRSSLFEFFSTISDELSSSFEDTNELFAAYQTMMTKMRTITDENAGEVLLKKFLSDDPFKGSLAGHLLELSDNVLKLDLNEINEIVEAISFTKIDDMWDLSGASSISEITSYGNHGNDSILPALFQSTSYTVNAKPIPLGMMSMTGDRYIPYKLSAAEMFGNDFTTSPNNEMAVVFFKILALSACADGEVRKGIRNRSFTALGKDWTFNAHVRERLLNQIHQVSSAISVQLACYRQAIDAVIHVKALGAVDLVQFVRSFMEDSDLADHFSISQLDASGIKTITDDFIKEYSNLMNVDFSEIGKDYEKIASNAFDMGDLSLPASNIRSSISVPPMITPSMNWAFGSEVEYPMSVHSIRNIIMAVGKKAPLKSLFRSILSIVKTMKPIGIMAQSPADASSIMRLAPAHYAYALPRAQKYAVLSNAGVKPEDLIFTPDDNTRSVIKDNTLMVGDNMVFGTVTSLERLLNSVRDGSCAAHVPNVLYNGSRPQQLSSGMVVKDNILEGGDVLGEDVFSALHLMNVNFSYDENDGKNKILRREANGYATLMQLSRIATMRNEWLMLGFGYDEVEVRSTTHGFMMRDLLAPLGLYDDFMVSLNEARAIKSYIDNLRDDNLFPFDWKSGCLDSNPATISLQNMLEVTASLRSSNGKYSGVLRWEMRLRGDAAMNFMASDKISVNALNDSEFFFKKNLMPMTDDESFHYVMSNYVSVSRPLFMGDLSNEDLDGIYNQWVKAITSTFGSSVMVKPSDAGTGADPEVGNTADSDPGSADEE